MTLIEDMRKIIIKNNLNQFDVYLSKLKLLLCLTVC